MPGSERRYLWPARTGPTRRAAYRFFSNDRVSEEDILRGHFDATRRRFAASDGPILVLHDTTEFYLEAQASWSGGLHHEGEQRQGQVRSGPHAHGLRAVDAFEPGGDDGRVAAGNGRGPSSGPERSSRGRTPSEEDQSQRAYRSRARRACAGWTTCANPPNCWTIPRAAFTSATAKAISGSCSAWPESWTPTSSSGAVPTGSPRTAPHTVASIMAEEKVRGLHRVAVRDGKGKLGSTQVEVSYRRMTIRPPIAKQKRYPALMLTVLHAREPGEPVGRPRIDWKLITRPAGRQPRCGRGEAAMVRHALEDRSLPQDPEIGLPGRAGATANR